MSGLFLKLIHHGAATVVHLLLLKFSMPKAANDVKWTMGHHSLFLCCCRFTIFAQSFILRHRKHFFWLIFNVRGRSGKIETQVVVVVAQLVKRSLLITEVRGSNLVIGKKLFIYWTFVYFQLCIEKTKIIKKWPNFLKKDWNTIGRFDGKIYKFCFKKEMGRTRLLFCLCSFISQCQMENLTILDKSVV